MAWLEQDFSTIWQEVSAELTQAVQRGKHPWHLMTLASIDAEGAPQARIVVLRGFAPDLPGLWFHTDYRSPKIAQLRQSPQAQLLLYDPQQKRQLRAKITATIHHQNDETRRRWEDARDSSRRCYLVQPGPSTLLPERQNTLPEPWQQGIPSPAEAAGGYPHFCAVACHIHQLDILQLNAQGGERCRLHFQQGTLTQGEWLAP